MGRCGYQVGDPISAYGGTNPMLGVGMGLRLKLGIWCCRCRRMDAEFGRTGGGRGSVRTDRWWLCMRR